MAWDSISHVACHNMMVRDIKKSQVQLILTVVHLFEEKPLSLDVSLYILIFWPKTLFSLNWFFHDSISTGNDISTFFIFPFISLSYANNRNTRNEIFSKLTKKAPEQCHWNHPGVFIVNFEHVLHCALVFFLNLEYVIS